VLIVMNHQSLLDIPTAMRLCRPYSPGFVTRSRYKYVPVIARSVRLIDGPFIDPRDPDAALAAIRRSAAASTHGMLIFPEGHRSVDGRVRRFRAGGLQAILEARRMPVYLIVTDGIWAARRLVDFVLNVPRIRGRAEVLGPFEPPESDDALPAFVAGLQQTVEATLAAWRRPPDSTAAAADRLSRSPSDERIAGAGPG
jgi:1-acyl-sn-glycerol-3-phosphate acyltransferase